jgi:hypothetical protein
MNKVPVIDPSATDSEGSGLSLAPYLKLQLNSGIGMKVQTYFLAGGSSKGNYANAITPFYSIDKKKIALDISYTHFFLAGNTSMPYTPITNEVYGSLTYKTTSVSPVAGVDLGFGNDTMENASAFDINIFAGVTHSYNWDLGKDKSLDFSPKLLLNIGTERYYTFLRSTGYITHSKNFKKVIKTNSHANGNGNGNGGGSTTTSSLPSIALNNLEANAAFNFSIGKFSIEPDMALYVPFNGDGQGVFGWWQLGLSYSFGK